MKDTIVYFYSLIVRLFTTNVGEKRMFPKKIILRKNLLTFVQSIKNGANYSYQTALYEDTKHKKYIYKTTTTKKKLLNKYLLCNEIKWLNALKNTVKEDKNITIPNIFRVVELKDIYGYLRSYIEGRPLSEYSKENKLSILNKVFIFFEKLEQEQINIKDMSMPKRKSYLMLLSFPFILTSFCIKNRYSARDCAYFLKIYITSWSFESLFHPIYTICHRDLSSENIYVHGNKIGLIDFETCTTAEKGTDLALSLRYFSQELDIHTLISLLKKKAITQEQKKAFLRLTIFYTFQFLLLEESDSIYYKEAIKYLFLLKKFIIPEINTNRSPFVPLFSKVILSLVNVLNFLTLNVFDKLPKRLILCYHSVGNDSWDFTISKKQFESQIEYLLKIYKFVSLDTIVNENNIRDNLISITFDDGYSNILKNALPYLKMKKIPATLFLLGSPELCNRSELRNNLELLSNKDIKKIVKEGWNVGFHTVTHPNLRALNRKELERQFVVGKQKYEKEIGIKLKYFAYPRGYYNDEIIRIVKKSGFECAFTVDAGNVSNIKIMRYKIPRLSIDKDLDIKQFQAAVSNLGILYERLLMKVLKFKETVFFF